MTAGDKVKNKVALKWPVEAFSDQVHAFISSSLCWILGGKCILTSKEKTEISYGLQTSCITPVGTNLCFPWVPTTHHSFVSLLKSLLTAFHKSQLFVSLVVSLNRLWALRGQNSASFTWAAPTEAIAVLFKWWTEGRTSKCLLKWEKYGWWL